MDELVLALKNVMSAEKDAYLGLLTLSERKKEILIKNDVEALNQVIREETYCMKGIRPLSSEREAILKRIAQQRGVFFALNIDAVISFTEGRMQQELGKLKQEFNQVLTRLSGLNELNKKLIQTQMDYTAFCIDTLTQNNDYGDTYNNTGYVADNNKKRFGFIDQKV